MKLFLIASSYDINVSLRDVSATLNEQLADKHRAAGRPVFVLDVEMHQIDSTKPGEHAHTAGQVKELVRRERVDPSLTDNDERNPEAESCLDKSWD